MKKLLTVLVLLISVTTFSQNNDSKFWDNVRFGGGFGLGFGSNSTTISIAPSAIYDFNDQFSLGASIGYLYNKRNDFKSNVYSGSLISLYNPINKIQLSAEFQELFVNRSLGNLEDNYNYPALYLGIAYRIGFASIGLRYDVLHDDTKSIYADAISPIIRIYF